MKRTSLIVVAFVLTLTQLQPTFAVDLSDTKRPSIKVRSIIEPGLPNDVLSVEIEYSDDKNLLRDLQLPFQIERAVQDLEAAPVCKMSVFSLPLQYLSKGEDVTRRQVTTNGVKQYFILRYLNQIARVDNGCPYVTKALVNGWGFWPFDEPLLTLDMTDEAGNRALWDGVATSTGSLPGNTDGRIARLPFDLSIKKLKSVCSPQIVTGSFSCQLARKALHATVNEGLILDGFGLKQTGLYTAILNNRQLVGNFNQSTQSFDSFESSINNDLRTMIISILAINSPLLPKLEDSSINASIKRYDAYQALVALADLSQTTNIVSLWNDWVLRIKTDVETKAKAEAEAKAKAEADAKAKADAEAKAKADAEANLKYELVLNQYQALMERIRLLKIKYPKETSLIGLEAKMMKLPIVKGSDLTSAIYNINSVNSSLDTSEKVWAKTQKTTIVCVKGKLTKKVTAINPKCPIGYKKK